MPTISDIPIRLSLEDIRRAWGPERTGLLTLSVSNSLQQLLRQIEAHQWLDAAINYQVLEVTGRDSAGLVAGGMKLNSTLVARYLQQATHLVFGVCTLGESLLRHMREFFDSKRPSQAVLLDEIGTLLLYKLGEHFEELLCQQAKLMGLQASGSFNPGDDGFDINEQGTVLQLAGGSDIGVTLQGRSILVPHKSLTAVIGLGLNMPAMTRAERCARCHSRDRCPHRQDLAAGAVA